MLRCSTCGNLPRPGTKMKLCAGCKLLSYCSRECQVAAWKGEGGVASHKAVCAAMLATRQGMIEDLGGKKEVKALPSAATTYLEIYSTPLMYLAHKLLLGKLDTHVMQLLAEYHAGAKPEFRLFGVNAISIQEMREQHPHAMRNLEQQQQYIHAEAQKRGYALPTACIWFRVLRVFGEEVTPGLHHRIFLFTSRVLGGDVASSQQLLEDLASPQSLSIEHVTELLNSGCMVELADAMLDALPNLLKPRTPEYRSAVEALLPPGTDTAEVLNDPARLSAVMHQLRYQGQSSSQAASSTPAAEARPDVAL